MTSQANSPLEILSLKPGDIVVVWVGDLKGEQKIQAGAKVSEALKARGLDNLVIALHDGAELSAIDPDTMARHGWVRKTQDVHQ